MSGEIDRLREGAGRDLHPLQVKLTYVGAQLKSVPSLAFTTFYHRLDMQWFVPLRRNGISYGNDDGEIWNFTIAPEEMTRVVQKLPTVADAQSPGVSLMLALKRSRLGDIGMEMLLDAQQAAEMSRVVFDALDPGNGVARKVMTLYAETLRGMAP
jgi:hypothetical protein